MMDDYCMRECVARYSNVCPGDANKCEDIRKRIPKIIRDYNSRTIFNGFIQGVGNEIHIFPFNNQEEDNIIDMRKNRKGVYESK